MPHHHKRRRSFLATRDETCPHCIEIIPWHQVLRVDYDYSVCPRCGRVYSIEGDFPMQLSAPQPRLHRVYMFFMLNRGWYCQFLEPDLKTPLPRKLTLNSPDKIREIHVRFGADRKLEDKSALEYAINTGRGSIWLSLTDQQYQKLRQPALAGNLPTEQDAPVREVRREP